MRRTIRLLAVGALASSVVVALPAGASNHLEPVLNGVDNPRGITFDSAGNMYVASAGTGGAAPCVGSPGGEGESCYGETGAVHKLLAADVMDGTASDAPAPGAAFVPSLPSHAPQEGPFAQGDAMGPADVSVGADDRLYFTIGLGADPAVRDQAPPNGLDGAGKEDAFATLHSVVAADGSDLQLEADLGALEATDPDGQGPDTNPFGVIADTANDLATVADSGGNTVVAVDLTETDPAAAASALHVLPPTMVPAPAFIGAPNGTNIPAQAVPTQHAIVDGQIALGQLTGFPFAPGSAGVWSVNLDRAMPWYVGFTNIMDVAEGPEGSLLVLEIASEGLLNAEPPTPPDGSLILVEENDGVVTRHLLADDIPMPGGLAVNPMDGDAYITTGSAFPDGGVVKFDLPDTIADATPLLSVTDDTATVDEDERLIAGDGEEDQFTEVVADVTENDSDNVETITPLNVAKGAVAEGSIVYQPAAHFNGSDAVPYRACTADDECVNGVLTVTVEETPTDRIAGETRIDTAVEASMGRFPDGAPQVIVARSDLYPDALAGGPLAKAIGGPILLTPGDSLAPATAAEIQRLGVSTVHVLGGPVAISDDVFDDIKAIVDDTQRIAGENRFETAVKIKDTLAAVTGAEATAAYVVEGADPDPTRGWPDAVAISGLASFNGLPILLVETDRVPDETAEALEGIDATVIGGPVAISDATQAAIDAAADDVDEIAGATRYETSQKIAEEARKAGMGNPLLALVSGGNWPDALVAGPLVAMNSESLLLVHPSDIAGSPETIEFIEEFGPFADLDLFGGPVAINAEVEAAVADANS